MQKKINVITLGCSKNTFDSEVLMAQLKASGLSVAHESTEEDSDIVIINTCGFIENARQESIDAILAYADAKKTGKVKKVFVTGCLSERYKPELQKEIPEIDAWFGTKELPQLLKTLHAGYSHELLGERMLTTPAHYAYFKISEGCDRPCSFCAIPLMRGSHASTPIEQLVENAKSLAKQGVRELILIAQDVTFYGMDLYKKRKLAALLRQLSDVNGIEWIRLQYAFPAGFPMDALDVMRERDNICNYLDMPLQHISDPILKSMLRGANAAQTKQLISDIREKVPGIALRTTLIAGYPGETEADFQQMLEWVEETRFERLGIFAYSHEEGTPAFQLKDDVPEKVKQERAEAVMEVQSHISHELNREKIGKTLRVLFDGKEGGHFIGRTAADSPEVDNEVLVPADGNYLRIGDFADIRITGAGHYELFGKVVG